MRRFWFAFFRLLPVAIVVAVATGFARVLPLMAAWACTTAVGAACAVTGALVLRSAKTNQITWRNRVAGLLLPWGYVLGRGQLPGIVLSCTVIWSALAAGVLLSFYVPAVPSPAPASPLPGQPAPAGFAGPWLLLAWIVDGACLCYLLAMLRKYFAMGSQVTRTQLKLVLVLVVMLVGSVVLHLAGHGGLGLLVAGGPVAVIGGGYGLFLAVILLFGRNVRWN